MSSIIHSATKEHLTKFSLDQDLAVRGAVSAIYLILGCWLGTMVLNVGITLCYCYRHKQKASSQE